MKLSGTGQIDQLGNERLGHNTLQDVPLQGVEERTFARNPATLGIKRLGNILGFQPGADLCASAETVLLPGEFVFGMRTRAAVRGILA